MWIFHNTTAFLMSSWHKPLFPKSGVRCEISGAKVPRWHTGTRSLALMALKRTVIEALQNNAPHDWIVQTTDGCTEHRSKLFSRAEPQKWLVAKPVIQATGVTDLLLPVDFDRCSVLYSI